MAFWSWSKIAGSNATADATINWAEGQSPSSVNDSARAMMARLAEYRDDISCGIGAGGTASAFTVATSQVFTSLAAMDGKSVGFIAPATNAAGCTLNVDGLGALPINIDVTTPIPAGVMVANSAYRVVYFNGIGQFRLCSLMGNPFNIPLGGMMPYIGATAPNSSFAFPFGQAISRTTYAALFALTGTAFGVGDGSTTFNIPDLRGRVAAGVDNMGGSAAGRLTSASGMGTGLLGQIGGAETETLTLAQLPTGITSANAAQAISVNSTSNKVVTGTVENAAAPGGSGNRVLDIDGGQGTMTSTGTANVTVTSNNTSGGAHPILQPTIAVNHILRII